MNTITITLALNDTTRTAHAIHTGIILPRQSEFRVDLTEFSPEQRAALLAVTGPATTFDASRTSTRTTSTALEFETPALPATPDAWISVLQANAAARATQHARELDAEIAEVARLMPELERMENLSDTELTGARIPDTRGTVYPETKAYNDRLKAMQARIYAARSVHDAWLRQQRDEEQARNQKSEAAAKAREAQAQADRAAWVTAHGSDYLKKAVNAGYDCQRLYVTERAAMEHPAYVVDYQDTARWNDRSCPSEAALDEALRVNGEVVWLTNHPADEDDRQCEAVVIRGYLGQYDLIRTYPE